MDLRRKFDSISSSVVDIVWNIPNLNDSNDVVTVSSEDVNTPNWFEIMGRYVKANSKNTIDIKILIHWNGWKETKFGKLDKRTEKK